jgi:hypothetical protein
VDLFEPLPEPERHPKRWIHPCTCTLIAHEQCLLTWIETKEADTTQNELKCPQCGTKYEIESKKTFLFQVLSTADNFMGRLGRKVTLVAIAVVGGAFGVTMYVLSTAYGAYAIRRLVGQELFDVILTDEPINWPWHAFLNLPLIPCSLILARTPLVAFSAFSMLGITWGTVSPIEPVVARINKYWGRPQQMLKLPPYPSASSNWPPSPFLLGAFVFPILRRIYRSYMTRLEHWLLHTHHRREDPPRRFEWAVDFLRLGVGIQVEAEEENAAGGAVRDEDNRDVGEEEEDVDGRGRTIRLTSASIGRTIAEALLIPDIASFMGSLLLRLSNKSFLLRQFLAVKPPIAGRVPLPNLGRWSVDSSMWGHRGFFSDLHIGAKIAAASLFGGSLTLTEYDPVWWRNAVGMGLFVVAKDCVYLLYQYHLRRERESRRIKNRSFAGIDVKDLDLIRPLRFY